MEVDGNAERPLRGGDTGDVIDVRRCVSRMCRIASDFARGKAEQGLHAVTRGR